MTEPARIASVPAELRITGYSPDIPDMDVIRKLARLEELESATSSLRHDVLSMMAPALLVADCLLMHSDPKVVKASETTVKVVIKIKERLLKTLPPRPEPDNRT